MDSHTTYSIIPPPGDGSDGTVKKIQFDEQSWQDLLYKMRNHQVIPVIGPELVTVQVGKSERIPLYEKLAEELKTRLKVTLPEKKSGPVSLNDVACAHLLNGKRSADIYTGLSYLVDKYVRDMSQPPQALLDLASITDFDLYITTTFDPLLECALKNKRPNFTPRRYREEYNFHCGTFHPSTSRDLPEEMKIPDPYLYYILGSHKSPQDFVVWEEDYVEYLHGMVEKRGNLENLFRLLKKRSLLLIGAPFHDWIVRLFLRIAKGKRHSLKSSGHQLDYAVSTESERIEEPSILFYDSNFGTTLAISGNPGNFATELARRWRADYEQVLDGDILEHMPEKPQEGGVIFISYAREDTAMARTFAEGLMRRQEIPWLDTYRLKPGLEYNECIESAVKEASLFLSLISKSTEGNPDGYVHKEREWAIQRQPRGFIFNIPVIIDDIEDVPEIFKGIHCERLPGGKATDPAIEEILNWIAELMKIIRTSGRPRSYGYR